MLLAAIGLGEGRAASFDCARAASATEHAICDDAVASHADDTLAKAYDAALAMLSPAGRDTLRDSERSFLRYAMGLCQPGGRPLEVPYQPPDQPAQTDRQLVAACLAGAYAERAEHLDHAVTRLAGYTFLSTRTYRIHATTVDGGNGPSREAVKSELVLLQIDAPQTPDTAAWNTANRKLLADSEAGEYTDDGDEEVHVDMSLISAAPGFAAFLTTVSTYAKGAAHPNAYWTARSWSFRLGRPLTAADIFDAGKPYAAALLRKLNDLTRKRRDGMEVDTTQIRSIKDAGSWEILPQGIKVDFGEYELGGYASATSTLLSWATLKPYLRQDMPFSIEALRAP